MSGGFFFMRVSHRHGPARLVTTPAALRAQALVIVAMLQVGVAAALSGPAAPAAAPAARLDLAVSFAERPVTGALTDAQSMLTGVGPSVLGPRADAPPSLPLLAAPTAAPAPQAAPKPGKRYIPHGTGMWTYQWSETEGGSAKKVVAKAKAAGLTHLYVRTGTRQGGFDGAPVLKKLLPATKGTGIAVIAWDFPQLAHPVADAHRLAAAARYTVKGAPRVAAVAPDIETGAEGTKLSGARVRTYLKTLRSLLPKDVSIIGVVPWPSEHRVGKYPFSKVAAYSDAIAPMAYWVNRDPATVARQTMQRLAVFHKPVVPIGQAYDPRIDVPSLRWGSPSRGAVAAFLRTAQKYGAPSASLWVWQFASREHWKAITSARTLYTD
jgi:hypothetical protein